MTFFPDQQGRFGMGNSWNSPDLSRFQVFWVNNFIEISCSGS